MQVRQRDLSAHSNPVVQNRPRITNEVQPSDKDIAKLLRSLHEKQPETEKQMPIAKSSTAAASEIESKSEIATSSKPAHDELGRPVST